MTFLRDPHRVSVELLNAPNPPGPWGGGGAGAVLWNELVVLRTIFIFRRVHTFFLLWATAKTRVQAAVVQTHPHQCTHTRSHTAALPWRL